MPVIDCGTLIDGRSDEPIADARLVVSEGDVVAVGPREDVDAPRDEEIRSFPDATVMPGLIDAHLHLIGTRSMEPMDRLLASDAYNAARATEDLRKLLAAGFTSVRDVGSPIALGLRDAVADGTIPGPRVYTSGQAISQTGGHGDSHFLPLDWMEDERGISTLADGPAECRKEARKRIRDGVDLLKIMTTGGTLSQKDEPTQSQFTDDEIRAMTQEAHRVGIPVASHAIGGDGIINALKNGVDTIEHGFYINDEAIDLMFETDATFVPTLAIMHRIVTEGEEHGVPEWGLKKCRKARDAHFDGARRAYESGVPIALGTDFMGPDLLPHGENTLEAELLVEDIGMDEMDVLKAATGHAGRTVPDDIGILSPGYAADFVVLDENPLDDITALRHVRSVYREGKPALENNEW